MAANYDLIVIGAGILGAATAWQYLQHYPGQRVLVLEKEPAPAAHQTGRNSGVIHAGVYYPPGSLKARYCRMGLEATVGFCRAQNLPVEQCGKLIVATDDAEAGRLEALLERCRQNGLSPEFLGAAELKKTEPSIRGVGAMLVRETGIADYSAITRRMLELASLAGASICYRAPVTALEEREGGVRVVTGERQYLSERLVNCAGLMADRLIRLQGLSTDFQIVPFRGEYYQLPARYNGLVRHLIYPVPDPALPFLGVHLTRMIDGSVTVGPNAVLAMAREGYGWREFNFKDMAEMMGYPGFWSLGRRYWRTGLKECRDSLFRTGYLKAVQKYCPQIQLQDLLPYRSGVRAQAVSRKGELLHDFKFVQTDRTLHLGNAPSPAATSAIPIAQAVVERLGK
ncbi:L-2-hydroxyglutarate oxidase [Bowmanella dokdonensis]|uniref:L-2-hydroxyglutarate oxidase n=1 Tax=Bowmanella dokdonensis TaxID=751969 RepID=A0A939IQJ7_9ALTE|nr:L-2-hydroxyglutarate oxidase [Bowmanella dokdonensis]MBN7824521.1 L-2-hydroxyglutarate oxidase [Bowmanella dokdonensis]